MEMGQRLRKLLLDPVLLIGSLLSIGAGVLLYRRDGQNPEEFALLVGLVMLVITLEIQAILTGQERSDRDTLLGRLAAAFEHDSWLADDIRRLLNHTANAEQRFGGSRARAACKALVVRISAELDHLAEGRIRFQDHHDFIAAAMATEGNRLRALTVDTPDPIYWQSEAGLQYLRAQREAIERGVAIDRVFIYNDWSPALDRVARMHREAGISVYRVDSRRLRPELRISQGVWDDDCGFEAQANADGEAFAYKLTIVPYEVKALRDRFDRVWRMCEPLPDPDSMASV